jgi:eukaryotic-like serine/threonine-protein kinase
LHFRRKAIKLYVFGTVVEVSTSVSYCGVAKTVPGYLGPYRLLNVVHTGHASQLWQAFDDGRQRMVGVKALTGKAVKDSEQIGYLEQEYQVGCKIKHPRIIEVFSFATDRGTPYLAMEWFSAPNLKRRIHAKDGLEKIVHLVPKIVEQAADALGHMHAQGWVHRDVKPENFLVNDEGEVKLIDFGLAKKAKRGLTKLFSLKSKPQGTPSYMSPEQIRGEALDQRADVYSFGCVLYELIVGNPPFTGTKLDELFQKHLKSPPPALDAVGKNLTSEFAQLLKRCLSKDPSGRPGSAADFLAELRGCKVFRIQPRRPISGGA